MLFLHANTQQTGQILSIYPFINRHSRFNEFVSSVATFSINHYLSALALVKIIFTVPLAAFGSSSTYLKAFILGSAGKIHTRIILGQIYSQLWNAARTNGPSWRWSAPAGSLYSPPSSFSVRSGLWHKRGNAIGRSRRYFPNNPSQIAASPILTSHLQELRS